MPLLWVCGGGLSPQSAEPTRHWKSHALNWIRRLALVAKVNTRLYLISEDGDASLSEDYSRTRRYPEPSFGDPAHQNATYIWAPPFVRFCVEPSDCFPPAFFPGDDRGQAVDRRQFER